MAGHRGFRPSQTCKFDLMKRRKKRSPKTESPFKPKYAELNDRFKSRILTRIKKRLLTIPENERPSDFDSLPDYFLFQILTLADKRFFTRSRRMTVNFDPKNPRTLIVLAGLGDSLNIVRKKFSKEISILRKLYEMIDQNTDCAEIVAKMERMLSDVK